MNNVMRILIFVLFSTSECTFINAMESNEHETTNIESSRPSRKRSREERDNRNNKNESEENKTPLTTQQRAEYETAMINSAMNGLDGLVQYFLLQGADINAKKEDGSSALFYAVYLNSDENMIKLLLEKGADINIQDNHGKTVLHHAIEDGMDDDMIKLLLEHGANINIQDNKGKTPLDLAQLNSDTSLPSLLLETARNC